MSVIPPRESQVSPNPTLAVTPELGETLRVLNISPTDTYRFAWNSRQYTIPPNGSDYMPFDAIKVYTGDPRSTNNVRTSRDSLGIVSFLPDRATEVRRLRLLYSAPFGEYMRAGDVGGIFVHTPDPSDTTLATKFAWDGVRVPMIQVFNIRGERIYTVLDDPEGTLNIPVSVTQSHVDRSDQLSRLVEQQSSIIEALSRRLGIDPNGPALDNQDDLLDLDPDPLLTADMADSHEDGTPIMQYNPSTDEIRAKIRRQSSDPTNIDDLPEDSP